MARKKADLGGGGPNWLDTYADMVTLLLTFFVLLFAMSSIDSGKWQALVKAFSSLNPSAQAAAEQLATNSEETDLSSLPPESAAAVNVSSVAGLDSSNPEEVKSFDDLYKYLQNYVDKNQMSDSVNVYKGDDYTFIVFQNSIFFDGDSAELRQDGKNILDYLCSGFKNISDQVGEIRIYGHTAQVGSSMDEREQTFDVKLSAERAANVELYIGFKNIISFKKMSSIGCGQYHPLVPHDGTEATRIKNRRVELYISKIDGINSTLDDIYGRINASGQKNADFSVSQSSGTAASSG